MTTITDVYMKQMLATTEQYSIVVLGDGPNKDIPQRAHIGWEHGRRNFHLRSQGLMPIICPVTVGSDLKGLTILNVDATRAKEIMDGDPSVIHGIFRYEVHSCVSFPGDALPKQ